MLIELRPNWVIPDGHCCPATPSSGNRTLHLFYSLLSLQKEIEKRTFYLGKYRTDEKNGVPHLLDLIGMSRDETDILYPFAKSAMADVYDALSSSTIGIPKKYHWEDKPNVAAIKQRIKAASTLQQSTSTIAATAQTDYLKIAGTIDFDISNEAQDVQDSIVKKAICPDISLVVNYATTKNNIATGDAVITTYTIPVTLTAQHITPTNTSATPITLQVSCSLPFSLKAQDGIYTAEQLSGDITITDLALSSYYEYIHPEVVLAGTQFTITNNTSAPAATEYKALQEFTTNDLPDKLSTVAEVVEQGEIIEEGIHYYFDIPNYFNDTLIEPLDNAVLEALVNRVIWHWLVISYPSEAATYDALYQSSIASLKTRCNIFQKHWTQRTPRIL